MLRALHAKDVVLESNFEFFDLPKIGRRLPKPVLSEKEVMQILSQTEHYGQRGIRDRAIMEVYYASGIRRRELSKLRLSDIDFEQFQLRVNQGKGFRDRYVPIAKRACFWIYKYLKEVRQTLSNEQSEDILFLANNGKPFRASQLSELVAKYIKLANIQKSGACNQYRHAAATHMVDNGADIRHVQEFLGHADLSTTPAATIAYSVGAGGAGGNNFNPNKKGNVGVDSTFGSITALGGGYGSDSTPAGDGGSGGGTGRGGAVAGTATQGDSGGGTGYGNDGSNCATVAQGTSGGGGGAGTAATQAPDSSSGGDGGDGKLFSNFTSYGVSGYFAGGGGGGGSSTHGSPGSGGGGSVPGGAGTANTGGGGGGVATAIYGDAGGTGFIGILYTPVTFTATGNFVSTATTANAAVTSMGGVITYTNTSGTNTLNTDIVLEVSADSGSNYSTATLVAAGTFSTGILQAVANDIAVTSGTGIQYRISFANQSSGSKEARINGVSLMY